MPRLRKTGHIYKSGSHLKVRHILKYVLHLEKCVTLGKMVTLPKIGQTYKIEPHSEKLVTL